ncbi:NAD(P)-binding protein [Mollisia scopiformis]|uniref:NAD(P)-binding protein n=1 Tax=Mollisia scopiformis TaxID=149040 RepID=A0A194WT48_MOLSC|nr:NAD(P)-binding protein [Mollisia scopiformis]KUJ10797.1 NAD(P)-binding protein [Mollisia scopiformis]
MSFTFPSSTGIAIHHTPYPFISPSKFTNKLTGKVILITGASRGIGRATLAFASTGASLALLSRTASTLSSLVQEITSLYPQTPTLSITADVLSSSPFTIIAEIEAKLGKVDILINNAGTYRMRPFLEEQTASDIDQWWHIFEVNVKAPIALMHACLPSFVEKKHGIVINVGSLVAAETSFPNVASYAASKAALLRVTELLDLELREKGVKSFYIHPGQVKTDMSLGRGAGEKGVVGSEMREVTKGFEPLLNDEPELAAWSMVALAVLAGKDGDERVGVLSGRYWNVEEDLGELLERTREIEEGGGLYRLGIGRL